MSSPGSKGSGESLITRIFSSQLNSLRVVGSFCAIFIVAFKFVLPEDVYDPLWQRLAIGGSILVLVAYSFLSEKFERFAPRVVSFILFVCTGWMMHLAVRNDFSEFYVTSFYLVNFSCLILFQGQTQMRLYSLVTILASIGVALLSNTDYNVIFFALVVFFINVMGNIATSFRIGVEKRLQKNETSYRRVLETTVDSNPAGIVLFAHKGTMIDCNRVFVETWGEDKESLLQMDRVQVFDRILTQLERPELLRSILTEGNIPETPLLVHTLDDRFFEISLRPLQGSNLREGSLWFFSEVTQAKRDKRQNAQVRDLLQRQNACITKLASNPELTSGDLETSFTEIARLSAPLIGADKISFWKFSEKEQRLDCLVEWLHPQGKARKGFQLFVEDFPEYFSQLQSQRLISISDCREYSPAQAFVEGIGNGPVLSMIDVPIWVDGKIAGGLTIENEFKTHKWTSEEETFAVALAELAGSAIAASQRQTLKKGLDRSLAVLKTVFDLSGVGILVMDLESVPLSYNDMFLSIWNLEEEFVKNGSKKEVIGYCKTQIRNLQEINDSLRRLRNGEVGTEETIIHFKDGRIIERQVGNLHIENTLQGRVWFFRDVTAKVRIAESLKKSERRNRVIINAIPDTIFRVTSAGEVVDFKGPLIHEQGLNINEIETPKLDTFLPDAFAEAILKSIKGAIQESNLQSFEYELDYRKISGDFQVRVSGIGKDEALVIIQDITERKKTERELVRRNFELDSFVYRASHDLKAPLNSLMGLIDILTMETEDQGLLQYVGLMNKSVIKLDTFIKNLTDFSRNARLEVVADPIDFQSSLQEIVDGLQFMDNAGDLQKEIEIEQDIPFSADPVRLNIILSNLISNAIKYQDPAKEVHSLRIQIKVTEKEALLELADNGVGIDKAFQEKIFGLFFRATNMAFGSGLGLYIVKNSVEKLGGNITFESNAGLGTTFRVSIPNQYHVRATEALVEAN